MSDCGIVPAAESFTVVVPSTCRHMRVTMLVAVVDVRSTVVVKIFAGTLDSVMVTLALNIAELLGRRRLADAKRRSF